MNWRAYHKQSLIGAPVLLVLLQLVPYGRTHENPPVVQEPDWNSPRTKELVTRACYDCHSNETRWPWYSHVAPASWVIQQHVDEGRAHLNFSEFQRHQPKGDDTVEEVADGEMPLPGYLLLHSEARLTDEEISDLLAGLTATFGTDD